METLYIKRMTTDVILADQSCLEKSHFNVHYVLQIRNFQ